VVDDGPMHVTIRRQSDILLAHATVVPRTDLNADARIIIVYFRTLVKTGPRGTPECTR